MVFRRSLRCIFVEDVPKETFRVVADMTLTRPLESRGEWLFIHMQERLV